MSGARQHGGPGTDSLSCGHSACQHQQRQRCKGSHQGSQATGERGAISGSLPPSKGTCVSLTAQQLLCNASVQVVMLELCRERIGMLQDQQSAEVCASPLQPLLWASSPLPSQSCSWHVQAPTASEMVAAWRQGQAGLLQVSLWCWKPGFLCWSTWCTSLAAMQACLSTHDGMACKLQVPSLRPQASCLQPPGCCQVVPCSVAHLPMLPAYSAGSVCLDAGTAGC